MNLYLVDATQLIIESKKDTAMLKEFQSILI